MIRKAGLLLSGCGSLDGSDPFEVVSCTIHLTEEGFRVIPLVLGDPQFHVVDHSSGREIEGESRNQLPEAARLCRDKLYKLDELSPRVLDALIIPGGQGSVKNLLTGFGADRNPSLHPLVEAFLSEALDEGVVIGVLSLGEFVVDRALGSSEQESDLLSLEPGKLLVDEERRIIRSAGSLTATSTAELHASIGQFVKAIAKMLDDELE